MPDLHYSQTEGMKLVESAVQELGPVFTLDKLKPIAERQGLSPKHLLKLISKLDSAGGLKSSSGAFTQSRRLCMQERSPRSL